MEEEEIETKKTGEQQAVARSLDFDATTREQKAELKRLLVRQ